MGLTAERKIDMPLSTARKRLRKKLEAAKAEEEAEKERIRKALEDKEAERIRKEREEEERIKREAEELKQAKKAARAARASYRQKAKASEEVPVV